MADFSLFDVPSYYGGLLGDQGVQDLQKKAMTTGLINAALGYLAQPKNQRYGSALPYIGKALAGGYQAGQETIASGLKDWETKQKIEQLKAQQEAVAKVSADNPDLGAMLKAYPTAAPGVLEKLYTPNKKAFQVLNTEQAKAYSLPEAPEGTAWQVNESGFSLVGKATKENQEKGFGAGTQGASLNFLVKGSGNSPEAIEYRKTPEYALAYREATKPQIVTQEVTDAQGNVRMVTRQVPAPALPRSILPPESVTQPTNVTQPGVQPTATQPTRVAGTTAESPYNIPSDVKSSPLAPSPGEIKDYRNKKNQAIQLNATLSDLNNFLSKNPDPALWGVGTTGATLQNKYEKALTQIRIAADLGVLNVQDLPRLQAMLPNPSNLETWIKGGGTLDTVTAAIKSEQDSLNRDINLWDTYLNPNAKQKAGEIPPSKPAVVNQALPMRGGVVDSLKLRNGVTYDLPGGQSGKWNAKKKVFE